MKKTFDTPGCDFEASREAELWCVEHGISFGAMERDQPRALFYDDCRVAKWSNLRPHERAQADGLMTGNMRSGPVTIELKGEEADYPVMDDDWRDDDD